MLYPKRERPLFDEDFQSPTSEYRAAPFWAWNTKLESDELVRQIDCLHDMGYGGFFMHVRTGMASRYLGDEFMDMVAACAEKAKANGMLAWLYDEDRWPSGAAGGLVTKDEKYRTRHLLLTREPYDDSAGPGSVIAFAGSRASSGRTRNGTFVACFDIVLGENGCLESYEKIDPSKVAKGFKLYAYEESALPSAWFNNQTYVNTLDPESIARFIEVTHESYAKRFKGDFGGVMPAIFTDEPQFSRKDALGFAFEQRDITLPWTGGIAESYRAVYGGEDIISGIPELIWDLPDGKASVIRYHYHDHIAELFASAFADQCGRWCEKNGLMLTGHMMSEESLESQTSALGDAMRSFRSFGLPGIDILCDRREFTTAKQAQSAARQYGCPGVLSELYGVTNWDFDFRGHKLQGDWQAALGITVRVPHLSWVSMNGEAKRDYPSTFNYQSPWYDKYPYIEDHFARVNTVMTRGKAVSKVAVVHPVESYWLHWGAKENTADIRAHMDARFHSLCDWLLRGLIDFDYICESTLPIQNEVSDITCEFPVGEMRYGTIIVPALETIRDTTLKRLQAFKKAGGRLIFLGEAPKYVDAVLSCEPLELWNESERLPFERYHILSALENERDIDIKDIAGVRKSGYIYQLRKEKGCKWLFIAHADNPANKDISGGEIVKITIKGEHSVTLYDTMTGNVERIPAQKKGGATIIEWPLYDHDSLLLKLDDSPGECANAAPELAPDMAGQECMDAVPVTLDEPNVLLIDFVSYALEGEDFRPPEEILRLDNRLRAELGWPLRGESFAQPWVESDESTPRTLRLKYVFESEIAVSGACLALENAGKAKVTLNGRSAGAVCGWYVDKCIGKVSLPDILQGENTLEVSYPYGRKVDIEAMYLLGDFGVCVKGVKCTVTEPVKELFFGDFTRQGLPFYGGNLTYHMKAVSDGGKLAVTVSNYRGHLLSVSVDGQERGIIALAPYSLAVDGLSDGSHDVDIKYYGCRVNTFGQLHRLNRDQPWWGPNSWRTQGVAWTYEYRFWEQGILKSPEIITPATGYQCKYAR